MPDAIKIDGLSEFVRNLRKVDADLGKSVRIALNQAADVVVGYARPRIPRRSGRAAATLKAQSTRTAVRVTEGSRRAPYVPWLDFGGRVGRKRSVIRPFLKDGRFIYAAYFDHKDEFVEVLETALVDLVRQAGFDVDA